MLPGRWVRSPPSLEPYAYIYTSVAILGHRSSQVPFPVYRGSLGIILWHNTCNRLSLRANFSYLMPPESSILPLCLPLLKSHPYCSISITEQHCSELHSVWIPLWPMASPPSSSSSQLISFRSFSPKAASCAFVGISNSAICETVPCVTCCSTLWMASQAVQTAWTSGRHHIGG